MRLKISSGCILIVIALLVGPVFAADYRAGLHLQLGDQVIDINKNDIEQVHIWHTNPSTAAVMLRLHPLPGDRIYKQTAKSLGQTALWVWNGRVVTVAKLTTALGQDITIPNFTAFEAEELSKVFADHLRSA